MNPRILFEVFIHKVDGLSDDHKIGSSLSVAGLPSSYLLRFSSSGRRVIHSLHLLVSVCGTLSPSAATLRVLQRPRETFTSE